MIPVTFNRMLGKLHLPASSASGLGVVIVPPHGLEALAATKSLRILADGLATAGHAVLRYDLPGTADSLGNDGDPDRLSAWTGSVATAAQVLRDHAGTSGIVVLGLRFGALIGTLGAQSIPDLAGLVLLDPVVRGRLYARELAITARAVAEGARLDPDATSTPEGLLVGGHLTTPDTLKGIGGLDLGKLPGPAAPVIILHRRGAADAAALASVWSAQTTMVAEEAPGFEGISISPTMAITPNEAFGRAIDWVGSLPCRAPNARSAIAAASLTGPGFTENAVTFGEGTRLFGVFCDPEIPDPAKPAVLIVNAGRNPHVGWARFGVDLARRLASDGVASLRIDLAGIGDGVDRPGAADAIESVLYHPATELETAAAIDLLAAHRPGPIVLSGACSGAYLAFHSAARDPRIAGLVLVNIQRFVWRRGETVAEAIASAYPLASSYVTKVWSARSWRRVLTGERQLWPLVREFARRAAGRLLAVVPSTETRRARALMSRLQARGVRVELFFSADDPGLGDLALHFGAGGRRLAGDPRIVMTLVPGSDHDLTPPAAREALFERVLAATRAVQGRAGENAGHPVTHGTTSA
jgi:alpha-beta hydrolase superfamily lysophospholipase